MSKAIVQTRHGVLELCSIMVLDELLMLIICLTKLQSSGRKLGADFVLLCHPSWA
jgi:hypothetical protein